MLRGNKFIDYSQLGMKHKLYACEVLFNRALCHHKISNHDKFLEDIEQAIKDRELIEHETMEFVKDDPSLGELITLPKDMIPLSEACFIWSFHLHVHVGLIQKEIIERYSQSEYKLEPNSPKYILPIPPTVLRFNPDMIPNIR